MRETMSERRQGTDVKGLYTRLRAAVRGKVHVDAAARALYTMDASNYRQVPAAVLVAQSVDDVVAAVSVAGEFGVPVVPRGGGTSLAGNACGNGLVVDVTQLDHILDIDPDERTARVQPGVVLDDLRAAGLPHRLTFGPDPSTHSRCTLGGMIGNNSCGSHSVAWGTTADNVEELDVLLSDGTRLTVGSSSPAELDRRAALPGREGQIHAALRDLAASNLAVVRREFGRLSRQVSGYALNWLLPEHRTHVARALVGTEGTCAIVLGATVRLVELPAATALLVLGFPDDVTAADAVPAILPLAPLTVESMDEQIVALRDATTVQGRPSLPDGGGWLFVEVGGEDAAQAVDRAARIVQACGNPPHRLLSDPAEQRALWRLRDDGSGIATRMADGSEAWPGWEDAAVPPERLGAYLRDFRELLSTHDLRGIPYGHFGEGCIHVRIDFDLTGPPDSGGNAAYRRFIEDAADLVARHGGSLSGEHGDGRVRSELLPRMYSAEALELFERFKAVWDPQDRLNPGVIVRPRRIDDDLRFAAVHPRPLPTAFSYPDDDGDFTQAVRRCIGVGKCRNTSDKAAGAVMCPSFQVTGQEQHSTRGRAHLLYEMLAGEVITDGWRSEAVHDALDLCLSCKGCRNDCPVNVDMATYKAEFLHRHYAGRLRPASHYSMGWLPLWLRLGALAPGPANAAMSSPVVSRVLKRAGGIAAERTLPAIAREPFTRWFRRTSVRSPGRPVLLWPDTFTNYFSPQVARATVDVLRAAGFDPRLPSGPVCCGLTWVSTGQLGMAKRVMRRTLRVVEPALTAGVPVVGIEPSCLSALRGDVPELLPADWRAAVLAERSSTLAGFLAEHAPRWSPPRRTGRALAQVHCHQHATLGFDAEENLLAAAGVTATRIGSSCCGLAGNFGFERGHYDVSQALAEQALLPAVREADPQTVIIADGFSCRTQIAQGSARRAVHLAEVLADRLGDGS